MNNVSMALTRPLNPRDGGYTDMSGYAKGPFAIMCPEALGVKWIPDADESGQVLAIHLATGKHIAVCRHGAQAFELCDELIARFPEFGRPFDEDRLMARLDEIVAVLREHKVLR